MSSKGERADALDPWRVASALYHRSGHDRGRENSREAFAKT